MKLFLGDCLNVLETLPDNSVDAVVTDPPYGIGFRYNVREVASNPKSYWEWLSPIYKETMRCLKPGGLLAWWQAQLNFKYLWEWFGDDIHIYAACKNFIQIRNIPFNYGYDPVVMKYKPGAAPLRPLNPKRSIDFFVSNIAGIITDMTRPEKAHPCPRPLDVVLEILENFTLANCIVLDPFMGSGTTGVACVQTGRDFIGVEIDETYFSVAEKRIAAAYAQTHEVTK